MRTINMTPLLLTAEGMFHGEDSLAVEQVLDHAVIDGDGRFLMPMIDVLAVLRIDADADLLLVHHRCCARRALRVQALVAHDDVFLRVQPAEPTSARHVTSWSAHLWSQRSGSSTPVRSLRATSFDSFVGLA